MSMDRILIERNGYTMFDLLSDLGGLQGILISGISFLLSILNFNHLNGFLASRLFKADQMALEAFSTNDSIKAFIIGLLPRKLVCCRERRKQVVMEQARAALEKELDIVHLVRSRRFIKIALKHLLGRQLRKEFKARSNFEEISV